MLEESDHQKNGPPSMLILVGFQFPPPVEQSSSSTAIKGIVKAKAAAVQWSRAR